jgi:hypothetical protein
MLYNNNNGQSPTNNANRHFEPNPGARVLIPLGYLHPDKGKHSAKSKQGRSYIRDNWGGGVYLYIYSCSHTVKTIALQKFKIIRILFL